MSVHQVWCVAYQDDVPYMDGPRTIRVGECASLEAAEANLKIVQSRSGNAPKQDLRIETRSVGEWRRLA